MNEHPRILLLGDSIRMSYQPMVAFQMQGRAVVTGPVDNGRFALYTSMRLGAWISECGEPDIVHWNNGIWDCGHNRFRGPQQFDVEDYLTNLGTILTALRTYTDRIIFATSTPVHPDKPHRPEGDWNWTNADIDRFNDAARKMMDSEGIPINDLNSVVAADPDKYLDDDMLHLTHEGRHACGAAVVEAIDRYALKEEK